jgi:hypothetical protein
MDDIATARERWAEQFMSDERLLGDLPDEAARLLLDHILTRLDAAASQSTSVEMLDTAAESLRAEALALAEQASAADDPEAFVRATVETAAGGAPYPATASAPSDRSPAEVSHDGSVLGQIASERHAPAGSLWQRLRRRAWFW